MFPSPGSISGKRPANVKCDDVDNKARQPVQMRQYCQVILCCVCVLDQSFAMSFYTPNLSFSITVAVCMESLCVWDFQKGLQEQKRARLRNTYANEHHQDQKVCVKPDFSTLPGRDVCFCLPCPTFTRASERRWADKVRQGHILLAGCV